MIIILNMWGSKVLNKQKQPSYDGKNAKPFPNTFLSCVLAERTTCDFIHRPNSVLYNSETGSKHANHTHANTTNTYQAIKKATMQL